MLKNFFEDFCHFKLSANYDMLFLNSDFIVVSVEVWKINQLRCFYVTATPSLICYMVQSAGKWSKLIWGKWKLFTAVPQTGAGQHPKSCLKMDRQKKTSETKIHLVQNCDTGAWKHKPVMGRGPTCCRKPNAMERTHWSLISHQGMKHIHRHAKHIQQHYYYSS